MKKRLLHHPVSLALTIFLLILSAVCNNPAPIVFGLLPIGIVFVLELLYKPSTYKGLNIYDTTSKAVIDALERRSREE